VFFGHAGKHTWVFLESQLSNPTLEIEGRLRLQRKKACSLVEQALIPGSDLLSHPVYRAVPSALEGLTTVFGMGTGVAPPLMPPEQPSYKIVISGKGRFTSQCNKCSAKPHGLLVPVGLTGYPASTSGLSTS
jgi:hypothetical protein